MALLSFQRTDTAPRLMPAPQREAFLRGYSIEVMPRTAEKIADFRALLPLGTRVFIAHIPGTRIGDMVATAARLRAQGMEPVPHFPARIIVDRETLADWIARYQAEAHVRHALVLGGGVSRPVGVFDSAMHLLDTGLFGDFEQINIAGHPEGNRDIDPDGGERVVMAALNLKQDFAARSDARMAIVTQFAFEAAPMIAWAERLRLAGIDLPVHLGLAGPAKLQTLIKFAITCGVGPSLRVLQKRARDVTRLLQPVDPGALVEALAAHRAAHPDFAVRGVHFFPLGGVAATAAWAIAHGGAAARPAQPA